MQQHQNSKTEEITYVGIRIRFTDGTFFNCEFSRPLTAREFEKRYTFRFGQVESMELIRGIEPLFPLPVEKHYLSELNPHIVQNKPLSISEWKTDVGVNVIIHERVDNT